MNSIYSLEESFFMESIRLVLHHVVFSGLRI
jgi:hypothetical protein